MRVFCKDISKEKYLNKEIKVSGWIKNIRKLGFLIFLELQDLTGMIQIVVSDKFVDIESVQKLTKESTVSIWGKLVERKSINKNILNGDLEIEISKLEIHNISKVPPLLIQEETDALEEVRFENRYLDLRRENIQRIFIFKSKLIQAIHAFFAKENFNYIETPILAKPTPEGARDFLVPSRIKNFSFYALPQSPQIYKQLLMVSGFERYYQIAKCFRDEDLRSDRQPEFTQLDIEMSFVDEEDVYLLTENLYKYLFSNLLNIDLKTPFLRMDYDFAMKHYGNDKPDIRFENLIQDSTSLFLNNELDFLGFDSNKDNLRSLVFENEISRNKLDELDQFLKNSSFKQTMWIKFKDNEFSGSLAKKIDHNILNEILKQHNVKTNNGIIFLNFDKEEKASIQLGVIRNWIAKEFNLYKEEFKFLWIVNWPLFEYAEEEKRFVAAHHPFTQPAISSHKTFDTDKENAKARSYDLVLNGVELGGGSIRIIDVEIQERLFKAIGLEEAEYKEKFDILLKAFEFGVPPHGGIAFGLDRLTQLLLKLPNIKEVIAFPKNTKAFDPMIKTPSDVSSIQLEELGLKKK